MLVSSVDSFEKYQKNEDGTGAWLWDAQALTRAAMQQATPRYGDKFEKIRIEILRRERNAGETKAEVLKMRQRMHEGHPNKTPLFDVKHDEGGMVGCGVHRSVFGAPVFRQVPAARQQLRQHQDAGDGV